MIDGRHRRRGGGLILVMVLASVMAIYLMADSQALFRLRHTLNEVETQQIERLQRTQTPASGQ